MAGGIFPGKPFAFNLKCIILTLIVASSYWYLPPKNLYLLVFFLWLPYVSLAWYDYAYDCKDKMQPTLFPYGRYVFLPFKPQGYQDQFDKMPKEQIEAMDSLDHNLTWSILVLIVGYFVVKSGTKLKRI